MTAYKFEGKCKRGPYDGRWLAHWSRRKLVYVKVGLFIREGVYEFLCGVWIWRGVRDDTIRAEVLR